MLLTKLKEQHFNSRTYFIQSTQCMIESISRCVDVRQLFNFYTIIVMHKPRQVSRITYCGFKVIITCITFTSEHGSTITGRNVANSK